MGVLLIIEDVASFFGSSVLSSLDSENERVETSSVVSDGVSFSISDSETIDSISAALSITHDVLLEFQLPPFCCDSSQIS